MSVPNDTDHFYWRVSPRIWQESWTDDTRMLALYLLTSPHRIAEGLYRLPMGYILADLRWTPGRLAEPFSQLLEDDFMRYDEEAEVVFICKALDYQPPRAEPNMVYAVRRLGDLPDTPLFAELHEAAETYCPRFATMMAERLADRIAKPPAKQGAKPPAKQGAKPPAKQGASPAPAPTTVKDSLSETRVSAAPKMTAPKESDWAKRADDVLAATAFPLDYQRLAELLAGENKTGKASLSRIVRELYEPLLDVEHDVDITADAMRHGLRAAVTASAPNARYVAKAARGYTPGGSPGNGRAASIDWEAVQ